ncbi:MAG: lytic transglycosylase domain-containing protein [Chloroflexi bacterium]|nr:lytic transglycosylase domain-containing protein [Chloroflexota bacterium]
MAVPLVVGRVATGLVGEDLGRWAVRLVLLVLVAAAVPMALAMLGFAALLGLANGLSGAPAGGGPLPGGPPTQAALAAIPPDQLALMQQVAANSSCHLPWTVLAAVADTESGFGANMATSSAGAVGYGQFLPATWAAYGQGGNPYDYRDALPAMARYLCASGAGQDLRGALWAYNHADWYVNEILQTADRYGGLGASGGGLVAGWSNAPALDQYDPRNYASSSMWQQWEAAACSAAALDWLLGAYGVRLNGIDQAIALIGPNTGISTRLGLLDATGQALAKAIVASGLTARNGQVHSIGELEAGLDRGPLALDGARWFGEGHWFVAIGYDQNGIYTRDSGGWDTRYLTWSRLYGEIGFSGWVVGVQVGR